MNIKTRIRVCELATAARLARQLEEFDLWLRSLSLGDFDGFISFCERELFSDGTPLPRADSESALAAFTVAERNAATDLRREWLAGL